MAKNKHLTVMNKVTVEKQAAWDDASSVFCHGCQTLGVDVGTEENALTHTRNSTTGPANAHLGQPKLGHTTLDRPAHTIIRSRDGLACCSFVANRLVCRTVHKAPCQQQNRYDARRFSRPNRPGQRMPHDRQTAEPFRKHCRAGAVERRERNRCLSTRKLDRCAQRGIQPVRSLFDGASLSRGLGLLNLRTSATQQARRKTCFVRFRAKFGHR